MKRSRILVSTATTIVAGALIVALTASQALAAVTVSQSTANAVGGNVVNTGTCSATNDQTKPSPGTQTDVAPTGALVNLDLGCTNGSGVGNNNTSLLSAAVGVQTAIANPAGSPLPAVASSFACAGVSGTGAGAIQIGPNAACSASGTGQGVNLLGGVLAADAVFATCSDTTGTPVGASTLVSANLGGPLANLLASLGVVGGLGMLPTTPPVNLSNPVSITLLNTTTQLLTLTLNEQSTSPSGTLTVTALDLTILPGLPNLNLLPGVTGLQSGLNIKIGTVTCGPNALVQATSSLPGKALPIAGGVLAIGAVAAFFGRRRLFSPFRG